MILTTYKQSCSICPGAKECGVLRMAVGSTRSALPLAHSLVTKIVVG
jgi:hypothetical protein